MCIGMKSKFRFSCILLLIVFCLSICSFSAFADDEEIGGDDVIITDVDPGTDYVEPETEYVDPDPETEYVDPETEDNYDDNGNDNGGNDDSNYSDSDNGGNDDSNYSEGGNDYSDDNSDNSYDNGGYVEDYYDDTSNEFENFNDNAAETAAPTEAIYDVKDKTDTKTLKDSDWEKIAEQLKSNSGDGGDSDDFGWIQNNTSKGDNGGEFFILGIILLVVGIGGVLFVASWYMVRYINLKKGKPAMAGAPAGAMPAKKQAKAAPQKPVSKESKRQIKKRSKFDTGEINLPQKAEKPGKYKPKH